MRQSTFKEALDINFIALKIVEKLGDESKQATILGNVGNLYYELEQNKSADNPNFHNPPWSRKVYIQRVAGY